MGLVKFLSSKNFSYTVHALPSCHVQCTMPLQVILSSLVELATINHQVSSEALDVLLNLLSSLQGEQKINIATCTCIVCTAYCTIYYYSQKFSPGGNFHPLPPGYNFIL